MNPDEVRRLYINSQLITSREQMLRLMGITDSELYEESVRRRTVIKATAVRLDKPLEITDGRS